MVKILQIFVHSPHILQPYEIHFIFLVAFCRIFWIFHIQNELSMNKNSFTSSFQIRMTFISCYYFSVLAGTSDTTLNGRDMNACHCLVPNPRGNVVNIFIIKYDVCCKLFS